MKKKIVYINTVCNGSTGKIMCDTARESVKAGFEAYCFYGRGNGNSSINTIKIGNKLSTLFHVLLARIGFNGYGSYFVTKKLIKKLKQMNPDIIHLHNIHGYYINFKVLFNYLKKEYKGKIVWMLHDCWSFTGHCSHYSNIACNKWQKECYNCRQLNCYPKEYIDTVRKEYLYKKRIFTGIDNLLLITPSNWLEEQVKKSFLSKYTIKTIYNGIDLNIFKPTYDETIYIKYNIPKNKKILLGVANIWDERKGFNIFLELSRIIKKDEIIVIVGVNQSQIKELPHNIIGITRTDNQTELVKMYSMATVFINPSTEETFSLVTVEAMACGLPVVVCGLTAPKELVNEKVGIVINKNKANEYYSAYQFLMENKLNKKEIIAHAQKFSNKKMINENIKIYKEQ